MDQTGTTVFPMMHLLRAHVALFIVIISKW